MLHPIVEYDWKKPNPPTANCTEVPEFTLDDLTKCDVALELVEGVLSLPSNAEGIRLSEYTPKFIENHK